MSSLARAIILATTHHEGQTDKRGNPYIFHPIRLMIKATNEVEQIIAILHDTIEHTNCKLNDLQSEGFNEEIVSAIDSLSRREEESYEEFILRIKQDPLARRVKILDLQDNMDLARIKKPTAKDKKRLEKYSKAIDVLLGY